jgi:hypothetical protein
MEKETFVYSDSIVPGDVLAVSDIHGCYEQYSAFLNWAKGSGARVLVCGDMIDRGPNDLGVLERTYDLLQDPESWGLGSFTALLGNHEILFLNAIEGYGWDDWVRNGGDWENVNKLKSHAEWIRELPYYSIIGDTLFSHSGVFPGRDPQEHMVSSTLREQFVWNRGSFLRDGPRFEGWSPMLRKAVFGHTPKFEEGEGQPYRVPDAVCVDSGCFFSGNLTAYNSTQDTFKLFTTK